MRKLAKKIVYFCHEKKKNVPPNAMLYSFAKKILDLKKKVKKKREKKIFLLLENTERFFDINIPISDYILPYFTVNQSQSQDN